MTLKTLIFLQKLITQKYFSSSTFSVEAVKKYNADQDKISIFTENRKKTGIYRWINNLNKNTYIGSSINLSVRFYSYFSLTYLIKSNRPIEKALLKDGYSNFTLEILEYCDRDNLLKREQYYLDNLKPEYNVLEKAGSTLGYKHTEESLNKMRKFIISDLVTTKKRLSTKKAIDSKRIKILIKNIETGENKQYKSLSEAAKCLKITKGAMSQALLSKKLLKKKYLIEKVQI